MKRWIPLLLAVVLLLSGCDSWSGGSYHHVVPHEDQGGSNSNQDITVSDYRSLVSALQMLVESGTESAIIFVQQYDESAIKKDIDNAVERILAHNPIAAYAVEELKCELGTNSGRSAIAVNISYTHDKREILKISRVKDMEAGMAVIAQRLDSCADSVVLYYDSYEETDFVQLVEDYAFQNPQMVMETPQVKVNIYPDSGIARVVELKFIYQTSRETLRSYQNHVRRIFAAANLYINSDAAASEKYSQLYSFLLQQEDYEVKTSITPAYSLLRHGEGDAKAFATVYAAMCAEADLNCMVVTGTRWGEAWYWNLIEDEDGWHHVDIIRCSQEAGYQLRTDIEMEGYVWDYEAYPDSVSSEPSPTEPIGE